MVVVCCRGNDSLSIDRVIREREREGEKHEFHVYTLLLFSLFFFFSSQPPHSHFLSIYIPPPLSLSRRQKLWNFPTYDDDDMVNVNFLRSIIQRIIAQHTNTYVVGLTAVFIRFHMLFHVMIFLFYHPFCWAFYARRCDDDDDDESLGTLNKKK